MIPIERKEKIKGIIYKNRSVTVSELASQLNVSSETIRRDLTSLEKEGFVEKTYGGAVMRNRVIGNLSNKELSSLFVENKRSIAMEASKFVEKGDCIFLDNSTTVFEMCNFIKAMSLTVVTCSLDVITFLSEFNNINLICPGGRFERRNNSFSGIEALEFFRKHHFDKAFISCRSIDISRGLCDSNEMSSEMHRLVINSSASVFALMDHTKINRSAFIFTCPMETISALIIDTKLNDTWKSYLDEREIQYVEAVVSG